MSIDKLQNAIRKQKNPSMVAFSLDKNQVPPAFSENEPDSLNAYRAYTKALLTALSGVVPAVRFRFGTFAAAGPRGLEILQALLAVAKEEKFYILLDTPEVYSGADAVLIQQSMAENWQYDGLLLNCYIGSDGLIPFLNEMKQNTKDLFLAFRTGNKSASEMQDQLAGSRLLYTVMADMASRLGEEMLGRKEYTRLAGVGPATSADSLRTLRCKYPAMFLLIDGYDYSGANAKNCAPAFDNLGHGAIACADTGIIAAWKEDRGDPVALAVEAAERMRKNLTRYVTIL